MTIPMNNTSTNSSREHAQLFYKKNAELEINPRKAAQAKITADPNAWQQMREKYESILLEDHAFSEQHDIEYALWQLHYKRIEELRARYNSAQASAPQTAKGVSQTGPDRLIKVRSQFKTFLSEATGFYHDLMVKISAKYGLSLGYMTDDSQNDEGNYSTDVKKGLISCHRCLIYLGDLARYKGLYVEGESKTRDFAAASSYYKQAATVMPSSGNPHHQLAILASYSGDELLAVYRYFRSLAVDTPFTTARDNLIIAFEKNRQSYCQLLADSKPTPTKKLPARMNGKGRNRGETRASLKDRKTELHILPEKDIIVPETLKAFSIRFVRLNGILFTRTSLETFVEVFSMARTDLLPLLSSGPDEVLNFGSDLNECKLFVTRFISIMIFTVHNANKETENQSYTEILQRSVVRQNAFTAIFDFMALIVDRCFQLKDPSGSFWLPGIKIFIEWLAYCGVNVVANEMDEKQATARSLFWNNLVSFLNKIMLSSSGSYNNDACFFNMSRYDEGETGNRFALPEDIELRGFLPLVPGQLILDFSTANDFGNVGNKEKNTRVQRIVATSKLIATNVQLGQQGISFDSNSNKFLYGVKPPHAEVPATNQEIIEEFEDEDEIIVFKPSVPEKHIVESSKGIIVSSTNSLIPHDGFHLEQFAQPNKSHSVVGQEDIEDGFSNLNLLGNGFDEQDHATMIPSKFDSVMTSAPGFDSIPAKTKLHKNPVGRPVRHFGPPPGFNNPKHMNENPGLDDYSWLDGYQLPYSGSYITDGFGNSVNCLPQPYKLLNTSKTTSLGMECFPFPGKQISTTVPANIGNGNGNGNGWLNSQISEHSSLYQKPVKKVNEQFLPVPQQYQGQSLWEGRFFV